MNKKELYPSIFLAVSLLSFSVGIPIIQEKIDYWKHQRDVYEGNLINAEFQRVVGVLALNTYEAMEILKSSYIAANPEALKLIEKIQKLYLEKSEKALASMQFLQTEPVNNDEKPDIKRFEKIKKTIKENALLLNKESDLFLDNFNRDYQKGIRFWSTLKTIAYSIAILAYFLGTWFSLRKRDQNEDLAKEIRGLIPRIDVLLKKSNKNT